MVDLEERLTYIQAELFLLVAIIYVTGVSVFHSLISLPKYCPPSTVPVMYTDGHKVCTVCMFFVVFAGPLWVSQLMCQAF